MPQRRSVSRPRQPRRPRITLDQLHTFVAVAEAEHVTAGAEALRLSQGSVSAAITRLERTLGVPLFKRVGRNVRLTDVGRGVRQLAIRTLDEAAAVERLTTGYAAFERGEVTIAAGRVTGAHLLSQWVAPFVQQFSHLELHVVLAPVSSLIGMLHDGTADVVFAGADVREPELETILLLESELVIVVAPHHPLAGHVATPHALRGHRLLAHESGTATQTRALRLLGEGVEVIRQLVLEEGALHAATLAGIGFAVMPRAAVASDLDAGRLVTVRHTGRPVWQPFTAARRRGLQTPAVQALWDRLRDTAATSQQRRPRRVIPRER